jgi:hypothetical protein
MGFPRLLEPPAHGHIQKFLQVLKTLLPFLVLTVVYLMVRTWALKGFSHPAAQISWLTVILTWPSLLLFYLKLLLWPVGLSPFYELQFVSHPTLCNTVLPAQVLLLVVGGIWVWASRTRAVALVIPWLVLPILPVLNVQIFGSGNFAHNRYLYLPSAGFAMLVALALRRIRRGRTIFGAIALSQALVVLGLATLFCFAIQVEDRYYASDAEFYSFAYSHMQYPDPVIGMDYANTLAEQGDFSRAAAIYQGLIQAHPEMWNAYFNLGYMSYQWGKLDLAVQNLSKAAAGDPTQAGYFFYLGLTDFKLNRMDEAEANLRRAISLAPSVPNSHFALGIVLKVKGNWPGAMAEFSKELEIDPGHQAAAQQLAEMRRQITGK